MNNSSGTVEVTAELSWDANNAYYSDASTSLTIYYTPRAGISVFKRDISGNEGAIWLGAHYTVEATFIDSDNNSVSYFKPIDNEIVVLMNDKYEQIDISSAKLIIQDDRHEYLMNYEPVRDASGFIRLTTSGLSFNQGNHNVNISYDISLNSRTHHNLDSSFNIGNLAEVTGYWIFNNELTASIGTDLEFLKPNADMANGTWFGGGDHSLVACPDGYSKYFERITPNENRFKFNLTDISNDNIGEMRWSSWNLVATPYTHHSAMWDQSWGDNWQGIVFNQLLNSDKIT